MASFGFIQQGRWSVSQPTNAECMEGNALMSDFVSKLSEAS
jgi:hypothetical protein